MENVKGRRGRALAALGAVALALTGCASDDAAEARPKPYSEMTVSELALQLAEDGLIGAGATVIVQEGLTMIDQGDRISMMVDQPLDLGPGLYRVLESEDGYELRREEVLRRG